jgi:hypothetical protein
VTLEQITAVCIGMTFNALTFVLGILVGCSLTRKDSPNDRDSQQKTIPSLWHQPPDLDVAGRTGCRQGGCANAKPEADPVKRAAWLWRDNGD